jgi:[acyl-carrier-protein] S-malonyltransferase
MAALLGLDDDAVRQACVDAAENDVLAPVNFNSPGQVVAAGNRAAIERLVILAKERGAKRALVLPVSVPSHCSLMKPAAEKLAEVLSNIDIQSPQIPVINNVDVSAPSDPAAIRDALVRQLYNPVRWVETVQKMAGEGVNHLIECGPGKVLVGLNKRIEKSMAAEAVFDPASLDAALGQ